MHGDNYLPGLVPDADVTPLTFRQPPIEHGASRWSDPDTSHEAAASVKTKHLEQLWLNLLRVHGGLTSFDVVGLTGLCISTISPRTATLQRKGLIVDSGERRVNPKTGRKSIVWVLS